MPSGRWKKLAIAGAILIVGIGTAFLFRREQSAEAPAVAKASEPVMQPAANQGAQRKPQAEPALAGRIEPFSPSVQTDSVGDASAGFTSSLDKPGAQTDSPLKWQNVQRQGESDTAAVSQPNRTTVERFAADRPTIVGHPAADKRHKIVDGDTLAVLALRYLGGEQRSLELFEYNRDVLITPELLPIGKELRIPPRDFMPANSPPVEPRSHALTAVVEPASTTHARETAASAPAVSTAITAAKPPAQTYVVQQHDTLPLIARKLYGDISRLGDLMAANRGQLRSAKDLRPGMALIVPAAPRDNRAYDGSPRPSP